ncbi:FAD-dependent oxidoreductase [Candidatus Pacearchaeota archaeon]|nr:FAD-dependent oxidoreductase [Candidatus Pacearchaeota archaeon]
MKEVYDVLILGGGPAGLTSGIYCGRYNLKSLIVAGNFGGTANLAGEVENWPGFMGSGRDLMNNIKKQAKKFGAEFLETSFEKVEKVDGLFVLHYGESFVKGKSLIVALGTEHRQLDIKGEKEFLGKGVSYCATCDGNFFKGKRVAVVGGADSAAKAALYLADICEKVTIIYRKHEMRCEPVSLSAICGKKNIEILYFSKPLEILGKGVVKGLKINTEGKGESILNVDGVFIEAGAVAATEVLKDLGLTMENGYVVTGKNCATNVLGVFAAGDVTNSEMRQMITAAGEGAVAAKGVHEFLMEK